MLDFTVAIPTYNGEKRLPDVLECLRSQLNTENVSWEVIVVDNNSKDETERVVREFQADWPQAYPLRYCFEGEQGAAFARQLAIKEARGKFVGFLDDDNLPDANWVAAAVAFGEAHPEVGAYGSQIHGLFEVEPPKEIKKLGCFLAIVERGTEAHRYEPKKKMLPPGAGLVVRAQAWEACVPSRLILNHKGKAAGFASEDLEATLYIQRAGWEVWHNPAMQLQHKIPACRLEKEYLVSLVRCVGLSRHHIRMLGLRFWQRPFAVPVYWINDIRKLVAHQLKYGGNIEHNLVVCCQRELLWTSLASPLFIWQSRAFQKKATKTPHWKEKFESVLGTVAQKVSTAP